MSGDIDGFLKVVARCEGEYRHVVLGVHIIGDGANELIQLGSVLVHNGATAEQVSNTPFAAVTLSGLYQTACDDVLLKSPLNRRRSGRAAKTQSPAQETVTSAAPSDQSPSAALKPPSTLGKSFVKQNAISSGGSDWLKSCLLYTSDAADE